MCQRLANEPARPVGGRSCEADQVGAPHVGRVDELPATLGIHRAARADRAKSMVQEAPGSAFTLAQPDCVETGADTVPLTVGADSTVRAIP
jgi:hypothetical protein